MTNESSTDYLKRHSRLAETTGCWLWVGLKDKGVGMAFRSSQKLSARKLSWETHYGHVPELMRVKHTCDEKSCINPAHLRLEAIKSSHTHDSGFIKNNVAIDTGTGCWNWTGKLNGNGYGRVAVGRGGVLMHRASWEIVNGPIPKGMGALHKCDNPKCVNPDHIFLGTQEDNMKDMAAKHRSSCGVRRYNAKLSEEAVRHIREDDRVSSAIAMDYGVSRRLISGIKNLERWGHVV